jgi:potassium voltage-gated channel Shaker-related subfamily A protein 1
LLNIRTTETRRNKRYTTLLLKDRIIINVCGDRFETHRTTLELYPDTLLGNHVRRKYYYDKIRNEYFFDRNRACFEAILYYYQSHGRIRRPPYVPIDVFLEEVAFFQLGAKALNEIRTEENIEEIKKVRLPKNRLLRHIWATMEYPSYSIIAKLVHILSLLMILVSTFSLAVESLPRYSSINDLACKKVHDVPNNTNRTDNNSSGDVYSCHTYLTSPFFLTQTGCVAFFTVELLLRIISTPSFIYFIKDIMNWIDVLAVVPYYITLIVRAADEENHIQTATYLILRLLRIIRLARVLKFYRLFKSVKSLRVLAETFKQSIPDFLIMITILTLLGFLFGAGTYYAENETNGQAFDSILKATYWGIITITSVG